MVAILVPEEVTKKVGSYELLRNIGKSAIGISIATFTLESLVRNIGGTGIDPFVTDSRFLVASSLLLGGVGVLSYRLAKYGTYYWDKCLGEYYDKYPEQGLWGEDFKRYINKR